MAEQEQFWGPPLPRYPNPPSVDRDQVQHWESEHGLRLPATLAEALTVQNGGCVRGSELYIDPLGEFSELNQLRWAHLWEYEGNRALGDPTRMVLIGSTLGVSVVLDYNPGKEPRVLFLHHNLGDELRDEGIGTFDDLVRLARQWGGP